MIRPSARSREFLRNFHQGNYRASPLFGLWSELLGRDRRLTRNFRIGFGDRICKLVEIRPEYQDDARHLARFAQQQDTYRSLVETGHLPELLERGDVSMIVAWADGRTLLEEPLKPKEVSALADCLAATYRRMSDMPNHLDRAALRSMAEDLAADGLLPVLIQEAVLQEIELMDVPDVIRVGETFGDVSLPNFVRSADGTVMYIDTMGVVDREPMMVNLEKMAANLPPEISERLLAEVDARIGNVLACRRWSVVARTLQVVRSKSKKGAVADQGARQQKMHDAVADLERHLQQKTV